MLALRFVFRGTISALLALLLASPLSTPCPAQTVTSGEVTGTVTDMTGAMVSGAFVVLKSLETGTATKVPSTAAGLYRFTFVPPGTYELSASSAGMKSPLTRIQVALGQVQAVELVMKIEEARRTVDVNGTTSLLDVDNGQITFTLSDGQLEALPLPGGDLVSVAYSVPGTVIANRYGTNGNFVLGAIGGLSNLYTINGADDMDPYWNLNNSGDGTPVETGLLLGANDVKEASVVQNAYGGQYGRQAGAQVNYVSKSGSNLFHGNLVYDYNGDVLNANNFFNNAAGLKRPRMISNQYAASFGGPLVRNKLFFFVDTEGLRYAKPGTAPVIAVPSKALEQYTLSKLQPSQTALYKQAFALYDAAPGRGHGVPVSNGAGTLQDKNGHLGCGALTGTATGLGGIFGKDVSCSDAYTVAIGADTSEWLGSARIDFNPGARQQVFLRVKTDHGTLPSNTDPISSVFSTATNQPDYDGQLTYTFVITPRLTDNFIGAGSYYSYVFSAANVAASLRTFPLRFNFLDGGANGSRGALSPLGPSPQFPQGHRETNLQLIDDVSYSFGRHWLKAGINYRFSRESDLQYLPFSQVGQFTFAGLDEFAAGTINPSSGSSYVQRFPTTPVLHARLYTLGFYLQDEWAATPELKLTATMRFDRSGNPECAEHCFSRLVSPFAEIAKGAAIPYQQSIQNRIAHAFYGVDAITVQPRVSFAYAPRRLRGTVIRGGIGLFSDMYPGFFASTLAGNPPNVFTSLIRTGSVNIAQPGSAPAVAAASAAAFENQFAAGATLAQLQSVVAPATFAPPFYYSVPRTLHTPEFAEWSFEAEQQIGKSQVATVRYMGNHGYNLFLANADMNAAVNTKNYPAGFGGLPSTTPDPRFASVTQLTNAGFSNYNGVTASIRRAFGSNLQGQISYTWSHALDLLSNGGLLGFAYDSQLAQLDPENSRSLNYSSSDYDVRHNLTLDFVWDVPLRAGNRLLRAAIGGWSVADKTNAYTGTPFSVFDGRLAARVGTNLGSALLASLVDPNVNTSCGHASVRTSCFAASQFASLTTQTNFGNRPRNSFRGPGYFDVDTSLYKNIAIRDRTRLTIGATAFNLFNHTNLADPNGNVASPVFGLISLAGSPPSSPYGLYGGPTGRVVVLTGRFAF